MATRRDWAELRGLADHPVLLFRPALAFGQDVFGDQAEYDALQAAQPTFIPRCPHCGASLATLISTERTIGDQGF